ncbi:MAG: hypothetical protein JWN96_2349 [Mycobacterium sp.]|nr:hypothetical protein [Mycobacterium sp.]
MRSTDIVIEVPPGAGIAEPFTIAVTVHLPDGPAPVSVVAIGLPGGGYNRGYYDIKLQGRPGYSQAEYHTSRGWIFIACDPAGVGESSAPRAPQTIRQVASVQAQVVRTVRERLAAGTLVEAQPPAASALLIGLGQSMGGCFTIAAQGAHDVYDAIGILGFSARHTQLPLPDGASVSVPAAPDGGAPSPEQVVAALMASFQWTFHWEDVPAEIAAWDMASVPMREGVNLPAWALRGASLPCGVDMLEPGIIAAEAAAVSVPVLVAQGARDVVPEPRREPAAYSAADHITIVSLPTMAHMHNFASTREQMWRAVHAWGESLLLSRAGV